MMLTSTHALVRRGFAFVTVAAGLWLAAGSSSCAAQSSATPFVTASLLDKFTAPSVPAFGPAEKAVDAPTWKSDPAMAALKLPGKGAAQHPMLYIGEGNNKMLLVRDGRVVWTYQTGTGWEYDDIWLLSDGDVLYSRMQYAEEITPDKRVVWHYDAAPGTEIHTLQPIGRDKIMLVVNGLPPRLIVLDKHTGRIETDHTVPAPSLTDKATVHGQFRRARVTAAGTYLLSFLTMNRVVEYDRDFKEIWSYAIRSPWAAIRLRNGNTLISDEQDALAREVNAKGETVWEFKLSELPKELKFTGSQTCVRLDNGNTVFCSRGDGGKGCQLVEITPDKKVVNVMYDWDHFGPATAVQLLDQAGRAEVPGELQM